MKTRRSEHILDWPQATLEQYKIIEARIDRVGTAQFGLWGSGIVALAAVATLETHGLPGWDGAYLIGATGILLTIIGWQSSIDADALRIQLTQFPGVRTLRGRERWPAEAQIAELIVWPALLVGTMSISIYNDTTRGLVCPQAALTFLGALSIFVQAIRRRRNFYVLRQVLGRPKRTVPRRILIAHRRKPLHRRLRG
jgi:hypothetical protein